jgi:hypothetical protein
MSIATTAPVSVWEAAHETDAARPRSRQTRLGASDTVCQRRAAYILAGTTPTDDADKRTAILGTYIHEGLLAAARTRYRWQVERTVADPLRSSLRSRDLTQRMSGQWGVGGFGLCVTSFR